MSTASMAVALSGDRGCDEGDHAERFQYFLECFDPGQYLLTNACITPLEGPIPRLKKTCLPPMHLLQIYGRWGDARALAAKYKELRPREAPFQNLKRAVRSAPARDLVVTDSIEELNAAVSPLPIPIFVNVNASQEETGSENFDDNPGLDEGPNVHSWGGIFGSGLRAKWPPQCWLEAIFRLFGCATWVNVPRPRGGSHFKMAAIENEAREQWGIGEWRTMQQPEAIFAACKIRPNANNKSWIEAFDR